MKFSLEVEDETLVQIFMNFAPLIEAYLKQSIEKSDKIQAAKLTLLQEERKAKELVAALHKTGAQVTEVRTAEELLKAIADAQPKTEETERVELKGEELEELDPEPVVEPTPEPEEVIMTASTEVPIFVEPEPAPTLTEPQVPELTLEPEEEYVQTASTEVLVEAEPVEIDPEPVVESSVAAIVEPEPEKVVVKKESKPEEPKSPAAKRIEESVTE